MLFSSKATPSFVYSFSGRSSLSYLLREPTRLTQEICRSGLTSFLERKIVLSNFIALRGSAQGSVIIPLVLYLF